jgi:hypothetical protein
MVQWIGVVAIVVRSAVYNHSMPYKIQGPKSVKKQCQLPESPVDNGCKVL